MENSIGLRLEDKNEWERRVVLTPSAVKSLKAQGIEIQVEKFPRRAFTDDLFVKAGANLVDDVSACDLVLGVKEIPISYFREGGAYMFFSHTIKGQPYNMKMLAKLVEKKCTLFDYECVTNEQGQRLIFFGRYAGIAGMVDTLWTLGKRLAALGTKTPFLEIKQTYAYESLESVKEAVSQVGRLIAEQGVPRSLAPLVIGVTGYGNVSKGAQEIIDLMPCVEISPNELASFVAKNGSLTDKIVKVVYKEEDLFEPKESSKSFDLQEYFDHPDRYKPMFTPHLENLSVLVNAIFWNEKYPVLASRDELAALFQGAASPKLVTIGDITCDIDGSLACTTRDTEPGDPVFVYDPKTHEAPSGFEGPGIAVMAVGNLPTELPIEASESFSAALEGFVPELAKVDLRASFDEAALPLPIRRSTILWKGEFTPNYKYMQDFLP